MKKLSVIVSLLLVAILSLGMVGCSSYSSLKKAFEKEGYEVVEEIEDLTKEYKEQAEEDKIALTIHALKKVDGLASTVVFIFEFNATEDMKKMYDGSETIKGFVKDIKDNEDVEAWQKALEDAGYAKGNCLVFTVNPLSINDVTTIVKNA